MANTNPTGTLKITGKYAAGQTLTVSPGTLADADGLGTITYKWIDKTNPALSVEIGTGSTYKLGVDDLTKRIDVVATYADGGTPSTTETMSVLNVLSNKVHTGVVKISGTPTIGSTLTAVSTVKDADGILPNGITYNWTATATAADGTLTTTSLGSGKTYKVVAADVNKSIAVTAYYVDKKGYLESESSIGSKVTYSSKTTSFDDILVSTSGADKMTGALGADTFKFTDATLSSVTDNVMDFNHSHKDKIDLSDIDANPSTVVNDAFVLGNKPTDVTVSSVGKLWFDDVNSVLYGSTDADIAPEFAINLVGVAVLETVDVVL